VLSETIKLDRNIDDVKPPIPDLIGGRNSLGGVNPPYLSYINPRQGPLGVSASDEFEKKKQKCLRLPRRKNQTLVA